MNRDPGLQRQAESTDEILNEVKGFGIMTVHHWILPLTFIGLTGCVNLSLPTGSGKQAQGVKFTAPASPYQNLSTDVADRAWVSSKTGNTISFLSDCGGKMDPTLQQLQSESLNVLSKLKIEDEQTIPYNGRQAMVATASGDLDGIAIKMKVLNLKKNSCNYNLSYTAISQHFDKELSQFQSFINEFQAP